jgi:hypothetical protein
MKTKLGVDMGCSILYQKPYSAEFGSNTHVIDCESDNSNDEEKKFMLLNLYGRPKLNHILVHRLRQLKRVGKKKFILPMMFLSVIVYLMNCLKTGTSSYPMPYHLLRN